MIKISVSQASKLIGISRKEMQKNIKSGRVQTHEGLITLDSLKRAYPALDLDQDSSKIIKRTNSIKEDSFYKKNKDELFRSEREKKLGSLIHELQETIKKQEKMINKLQNRGK
jgi:hypothetical protein